MRADGGARPGAPHGALCLLLLCFAAIAGCASAPQLPPDRSYAGRFSAVATQGDRREAISGRFTYEVRGPQQVVDLATPLGNTVARIEIGPDGARASGSGVQPVQGRDAEALTEQLLGWRLPVSGLADWIEGRPSPATPAQVQREGDRVQQIIQQGWTVTVQETFATSRRPRLLVLERPATRLAPGVVVRLVLDDPAA